jgi:cell division protein FtsZ
VPASVFDDDFFQSSGHGRIAGAGDGGLKEASHFSAPIRVQQQESIRVLMAEPGDAVGQEGSFNAAGSPGETDELDIPAFLRRGN